MGMPTVDVLNLCRRRDLTPSRAFWIAGTSSATSRPMMAIVANSSTSARPRREKWDDTKPLGPWEELAQVLLVSGEFMLIP